MNKEAKNAEQGAAENAVTELREENVVKTANSDNNGSENISQIIVSKADYDKAIQSAEDKVRGKLHKQIKELETKISALEPPETAEKSEAEKELEERLREIEAREKLVNLKDRLYGKNLDGSFADFLKADADVESFNLLLGKLLAEKAGYVPAPHKNNKGISADDWSRMGYDEKLAFRETNPEMTDAFLKRFKV